MYFILNKKKIKDFYKKNTAKTWLLLLFIVVVIFVFHDAVLYKKPIGKVTNISVKHSRTDTNFNNEGRKDQEPIYEQVLTIKVLNGTYKGKKVIVKEEYGYSLIDSEKYKKGDCVFLNITGNKHDFSASIQGVKRDQYVMLLVVVLAYFIIFLMGKRGVLIFLSLVINVGVFIYGLNLYQKGNDLRSICNVLIFFFTVITLFLVNGVNQRSFIAIISTFITIFFTILIFQMVLKYGGNIDYAALDYITGNQDLELIFIASISIAGLGAIMDVSVTISTALNELIVKKPEMKGRELIYSGKELGYDIMGTMTNVLLFTYVCGLFPLIIIKMKNSISLLTIIKRQIPFEISRFLIGGIGILLAIPVTIGVSLIWITIRRQKR
ncbi:MAG: YibE/F family protein [Lachnospiraceae bacterium]